MILVRVALEHDQQQGNINRVTIVYLLATMRPLLVGEQINLLINFMGFLPA